MLVTRYNPLQEFQEFKKGFDLLNSMFNKMIEKREAVSKIDFTPTVNTREGENAYHIEVDLPGVKKEDINVDVKDGILTISGERKTKEEISQEDYYRLESSYGRFERSFSLPENVDEENIHAESQDGILEVIIPKLEKKEEKAKRIEVK